MVDTLGTDPLVRDSDGNGASDGQEVAAGTDPLVAASHPANYVACWRNNNEGQCNVPDGLGPVIAVAAGNSHTLALRADGTVAAWGRNSEGECDVPEVLFCVVAIVAGYNSSLGSDRLGNVSAWGSNTFNSRLLPEGLVPVQAIAASHFFGMALQTDGKVAAWGYNAYHQSDVPPGLESVRAISAGQYHAVALVDTPAAARFLTASVGGLSGLSMVRQLAFSGNADRFRADFLPPGLSFDTATATLSGVPQASGTFLIRVTAETGFERSTRFIRLRVGK